MYPSQTPTTSGSLVAAPGTPAWSFWPRLDGYHEEQEQQRRLISGDPTLRELVRMATLAANGHNTQPWKFRLGDARIDILPDVSRRTQIVDPDDHHLYVSLGCAAENLAIAAAAKGRVPDISITNDQDTQIAVTLENGPSADNNLYQAIPQRQSTRTQYDGKPVSASDIDLMMKAAQEDGVTVAVFTEPSDREAILEFVIEGNSTQMGDPAFVAELKDWIRFGPDQAIRRGDGLFSACSGNPVIPGWIGQPLFRIFFTRKRENDKYRDQIRSSAGIAVFVGDQPDPEHWIKVGRSFERFALQATALGIRNAHINQPIEVASLRSEFARWLGVPGARPDLVVRFGRAPAMPMSLRRPIDQVLI